MSYKWWILIAFLLFGIGFVSGLETTTSVLPFASEEIQALKRLSQFLASLPPIVMVLLLFARNASVLVLSFALSPLFCLVPAFTLAANGWLLGFISVEVVKKESLGFVLAGLLPHGIIEIPAFIIGEAAAISFGAMVILAVFRKGGREQLLPVTKRALKYLVVALILLVPAAIIETFVTPLLIS